MKRLLLVCMVGLLLPWLAFAKLAVLAPNIALMSPQGIALLQQSHNKADYYTLSAYFVTQKNLTYCAVASSVMVLNALQVPAPESSIYASYKFFTQDNVFTPAVLKVTTPARVSHAGMTLDQVGALLKSFHLQVNTVHASHSSLKKFRQAAIKALRSANVYVLVNMVRNKMHELGGGHLSPLAAYHHKTDRFLMLDVSRYKYPPVWVKTVDLWHAMNSMDMAAKKTRGYIIVKK